MHLIKMLKCSLCLSILNIVSQIIFCSLYVKNVLVKNEMPR
jgi:hypothetical protein